MIFQGQYKTNLFKGKRSKGKYSSIYSDHSRANIQKDTKNRFWKIRSIPSSTIYFEDQTNIRFDVKLQ